MLCKYIHTKNLSINTITKDIITMKKLLILLGIFIMIFIACNKQKEIKVLDYKLIGKWNAYADTIGINKARYFLNSHYIFRRSECEYYKLEYCDNPLLNPEKESILKFYDWHVKDSYIIFEQLLEDVFYHERFKRSYTYISDSVIIINDRMYYKE